MLKGTIHNLLGQVFKIKLPVKYVNGDWMSVGGVGSVIRQVHKQLKDKGLMSFDKLWVVNSVNFIFDLLTRFVKF